MRIGRFVKSSLSAWKGRNSCVMEVRGSIVRCPAVVPPELFETEGPCIDPAEIADYIGRHLDVIGAVVVAGGEPFAQSDLFGFLKSLRPLGLPVSVRTEGMYPEILDDLAGARMFSHVTVTVPYGERYLQNREPLLRSLGVLRESDIDYTVEFYAAPGSANDIAGISKLMGPHGTMAIIAVDPNATADPSLVSTKPLRKKELLELYNEAKRYTKKVELRGL